MFARSAIHAYTRVQNMHIISPKYILSTCIAHILIYVYTRIEKKSSTGFPSLASSSSSPPRFRPPYHMIETSSYGCAFVFSPPFFFATLLSPSAPYNLGRLLSRRRWGTGRVGWGPFFGASTSRPFPSSCHLGEQTVLYIRALSVYIMREWRNAIARDFSRRLFRPSFVIGMPRFPFWKKRM